MQIYVSKASDFINNSHVVIIAAMNCDFVTVKIFCIVTTFNHRKRQKKQGQKISFHSFWNDVCRWRFIVIEV